MVSELYIPVLSYFEGREGGREGGINVVIYLAALWFSIFKNILKNKFFFLEKYVVITNDKHNRNVI
jgi:hypothetical protein